MADVGDLVGNSCRRKDPGQKRVAVLATRQHGVVGHWQLIAMGIPAHVIQHWLRAGRLHSIHVGVYAVGHSAIGARGRWMAGVLACGPEAVLSHQCAAALLGLRASSSAAIHVTAPGRGRKGPGGITLHRARSLHPDDISRCEIIPVTSVSRTLLDIAEVLPPRELMRAIEEAERRGLFDLRAIDALIARSRGRRGLRPLRTALREVDAEPPRTRSEFERDFLYFCADNGLPRPEINVLVEGYEVDAIWREQKLIVELDGYEFHRSRRAYESDRERDAVLQLAEHRVVRITWARFTRHRAEVAQTVRALLATGASDVSGAAIARR